MTESQSQISVQSTEELFQAYDNLGTDEKLALLYYIYEKMGDSVTPAAPNAAEPDLAGNIITDLYGLSHEDQLNAMREIVDGADTQISRLYGGLADKNQLFIWYAWAEEMGNRVVDMPQGYQATETIKQILSQIERIDFQAQISFLKAAASAMGYSEISRPPSQAETGKTSSL